MTYILTAVQRDRELLLSTEGDIQEIAAKVCDK